ncbi:hypothetical protein EsVE80_16580 [Enterococcus saigonensis]|uniref:ABC transporter permease n=1 Tax=Enterococcus saigonensis TaxID=1805431 RepID=A0A679IKQ4_9ENTE|nr:ABC transporter permease [Enterococcus saigonensis]BCA86135.1 hypothetical protein EsVE80_16580 [Enterococcus saigonensis]
MLKRIYLKRYGKTLIAFAILIFGLYFLNAHGTVSSWHAQNKYYHSSDFERSFKEQPESFTYWDDKLEKDMTYTSIKEYISDQLYVYGRAYPDHHISAQQAQEYNPKTTYFTRFGGDFNILTIFIVSLAGFLIFFVDEKTAFNRFLFGLPQKRKQLFGAKLLYVALPILMIFLLAQLFYITYLKIGIPDPYLNASWSQLIHSIINNFSLTILLFAVSIFIGSMVGNLAFGPLTWVIFSFLASLIPSSVSNFFNLFSFNQPKGYPFNLENLFIVRIGKTGGYWWMIPIFLVISLLFIWWTYRKFKNLSLENDGDYLLHHSSRWPVWFLMWGFTSFIALNYFTNPWQTYLVLKDSSKAVSLFSTISSTALVLVILGLVLFVVVFFSSIKNVWQNYRGKRNNLDVTRF